MSKKLFKLLYFPLDLSYFSSSSPTTHVLSNHPHPCLTDSTSFDFHELFFLFFSISTLTYIREWKNVSSHKQNRYHVMNFMCGIHEKMLIEVIGKCLETSMGELAFYYYFKLNMQGNVLKNTS